MTTVQTNRICWSAVVASAMLVFGSNSAIAQQVRKEPAERYFVDGPTDVPISIRLPPGAVLVFDEKFNSRYVTKGRELRIRAPKIEVIGNAVVRVWPPDTVAETNTAVGGAGGNGGRGGDGGYPKGGDGAPGIVGETGPTGHSGVSGRDITIEVDEVLGSGNLTLVVSGGNGGRGGVGGRGGNGGSGGDGRNRSDSYFAGFQHRNGSPPGNGGTGGRGGDGGKGGTGGTGGVAGNVYHYSELCSLLKAKKVQLLLTGGAGGEKGPGGTFGQPGGHGGFGHGSRDGGGGSNGSSGPASGQPGGAQPGPVGELGQAGANGYARCLGGDGCANFQCTE